MSNPSSLDIDVETILDLASAAAEDSEDFGAESEILQDVTLRLLLSVSELTFAEFMESPAVASLEDATDSTRPKSDRLKTIAWLIQAADEHGHDDPDHTVGDFQDMLRELWPLTSAQAHFDVLTMETDTSGALDHAVDILTGGHALAVDDDQVNEDILAAAKAAFSAEQAANTPDHHLCNAYLLKLATDGYDSDRTGQHPLKRDRG